MDTIIFGALTVVCAIVVLFVIILLKRKIDDMDAVPISKVKDLNVNLGTPLQEPPTLPDINLDGDEDASVEEVKLPPAEVTVDEREVVPEPQAEPVQTSEPIQTKSQDTENYQEKIDELKETLRTKQKELEVEITRLKDENGKLKTKVNELSELDSARAEAEGKVRAIEDQLKVSQEREKQQADKIRTLEEQVYTPSNIDHSMEKLEEKHKVEIQDMRLEMNRLKEQNSELQSKADDVAKKLQSQLDHANETIQALKDKQSSEDVAKQEAQKPDPAMFPMVELKGEHDRLLKNKVDLEKSISELKEYNNRLVEKERILSYELSKSRAHNLGLEKICEDFKDQIERLSAYAPEQSQ